jgi:predicted DNA binding CopG/RHH family protein
MSKAKIEDTAEAWESGQLGRDIEHAKPAPQALEAQIDESLGMQMISIRLPKDLIDDFKKIAECRGVGYQPLMREALQRFVVAEYKLIAAEYANLKATTATPTPKDTARRGKQAA